MELRQLRYFVAVAQELHFGRAARRMRVSQPPLSRQIADLERQLGVRLLNRTSHHVELTAAGRAFLSESREILAAVERAKATVRSTGAEPSGVLRMGFVPTNGWPLKSNVMRQVIARYPGISLDLEPLSSAEQLRAIRARQIDAGIIWETVKRSRSSNVDRLVVREVEAQLGIEPNHQFARRRRVSIEQLTGETLIIAHRRENPEIHDALLNALKRYRARPKVLYRTGVGILDMVAAGAGVCLLLSSAPAIRQDLTRRAFSKPLLIVRMSIVWLRGSEPPALRGFLDVATELKDAGQLA